MFLRAHRLRWLISMLAIGPVAVAATPTAARNVGVEQLDRLLGQLKYQSDGKAAKQLSDLTLTERASEAQLARWEESFKGPRARKALVALVDASAFLAPPASNIPPIPPPDEATRQEILARVTAYAKQSAQMLPNFLATRSTVSFEVATENQLNTQSTMGLLFKKQQGSQAHFEALGPAASSGPDAQLFWVGSSSQTVAYREGSEVADAEGATTGAAVKSPTTMTTVGEFGPMLPGLFEESSPQELIWDHWEDGSMGRLAVFHYFVPRDRSRFALKLAEDAPPDFPAHHGEVFVDPESGAILRISMIARVREAGGPREAGLAVEFRPTEIGGKTYICVAHSVAFAKFFSAFADLDNHPPPIPLQTTLNDVTFTEYRVFRTTSRIVADTNVP